MMPWILKDNAPTGADDIALAPIVGLNQKRSDELQRRKARNAARWKA